MLSNYLTTHSLLASCSTVQWFLAWRSLSDGWYGLEVCNIA